MKRTATSRDQRDRAFAVVRFPRGEVLVHVQDVAIRPGKGIQIHNGRPRRRAMNPAALVFEYDAGHLFKIFHTFRLKPRYQLLQCQLTFTDTDDVDAIGEVLVVPFRSIRPANNDELDTVGFCDVRETEYVFTGNDVRVEADNAGLETFNDRFEVCKV